MKKLACVAIVGLFGGFSVLTRGNEAGAPVLSLNAADEKSLVLSGDAVAAWSDPQTQAALQQPSPDHRPRLRRQELHGHGVLHFDGGQYLLGKPALPEACEKYTIIALWRAERNDQSQSIVEQAGHTLAANQRAALLATPMAFGFNGESNDRHDLVPFQPDEWHLTCLSVDNTSEHNISIVDNGQFYSGHTPRHDALRVAAATLTVGRKATVDSEYFSGDIAQIVIYPRLLDQPEQKQVLDRIASQWGATDELRVRADIKTSPLYDETYRPQFHFSAKKNWLNDPNGLVFYQGEYHLFFQANPIGMTSDGIMSWGHAVSDDLLHWKELEIAIAPDNLGSIWSGSAVIDWNNTSGFATGPEKTIVCIYCCAGGVNPESKGQPFTQCLSYSNDRGRTWTKYEKNPVVRHIAGGNRDPKVVWDPGSKQWIMALYLENQVYALLGSPDLKNWQMLERLERFGCDECPDFYQIAVEGKPEEKKWVFAGANGNYLVGDFDGKHFAPVSRQAQRIEWGRNCYADQTYSDIPSSDGRRILIGWMVGGVYPQMPFNQQMSFPTELKLRHSDGGYRLYRTPVAEIAKIRDKSWAWHDVAGDALAGLLTDVDSDLVEMDATVEPGSAKGFEIGIRGQRISYQADTHTVACLGATAELPQVDGRVKLHILVDRASIELYGNDGYVAMSSCFTPNPGNRKYLFRAVGGAAKVVELKAYTLKSVWR